MQKKLIVIESSDCVFKKMIIMNSIARKRWRRNQPISDVQADMCSFAAPLRLVPRTLFFPWQPHTRSSLSSGARHRAGIHSHTEWGGWGTSVTLKTRANSRTKPVTSVSHCWSKTISYFLVLSNRMNIFCAGCSWSLSAGPTWFGDSEAWVMEPRYQPPEPKRKNIFSAL